MDLYVPESWDRVEDSECDLMRKKTRMPEGARFREKWRIALEQIDCARRDGVPHRAVLADSSYGDVPEFRQQLAEREEKYVVGVRSNAEVFLESPVAEIPRPKKRKRGRPSKSPKVIEMNPRPIKVSDLGEKIEEDSWEHLELRRDSQGKPLIVEAVSRRVWPTHGCRKRHLHEEVWLIIERRRSSDGQFELRYFYSNMPQTMPTIELVRLLHERFWIEQGYQQLKEELGLDHHEGRSWIGWHRHVLLTFLAFGYLTRLRIQEKKQQIQQLWNRRLSL
jgi:SRSO17 transposase